MTIADSPSSDLIKEFLADTMLGEAGCEDSVNGAVAAADRLAELDVTERKFFDAWTPERVSAMAKKIEAAEIEKELKLELLYFIRDARRGVSNAMSMRIESTRRGHFLLETVQRLNTELTGKTAELRARARAEDPARKAAELDEAKRLGALARDHEIDAARREIAALKRRVEELTTAKARLREALARKAS